jgi:hypothetical protein
MPSTHTAHKPIQLKHHCPPTQLTWDPASSAVPPSSSVTDCGYLQHNILNSIVNSFDYILYLNSVWLTKVSCDFLKPSVLHPVCMCVTDNSLKNYDLDSKATESKTCVL